MRIVKRTYKQSSENFKLISEFELENNYKEDIEKGLSSIFLLSQNLPVREVSDLFSKENFPLSECFEELESSYLLVKCGFYKQSMISLRTSLEIGLLSIYWSIIGKESEEFKKWGSSKTDTPYKDKKFWKVFEKNKSIRLFNNRYNLIEEIKALDLSDFVHTKGILFSNYGEFHRKLHGHGIIENFQDWYDKFKKIVQIIEKLHLLRFPTMYPQFSTEFLISKFGVFSKIPMFGGGHGDEMRLVLSFIPKEQIEYIELLVDSNEEVKHLKKWLKGLPNLSNNEIKERIFQEQKEKIKNSGFENWVKNAKLYDIRITKDMINELRKWAIQEKVMNVKEIIEKHKKASS